MINAGLSGAWFNPATPGQGWVFDVIVRDEGTELFAAWFTYNDQATDSEDTRFGSSQHRWFTATGPADGATADMLIYSNTGGRFNSGQATELSTVGSMVVTFSDCANATVSFDFDDPAIPDATVPAIRLSPDVFCQSFRR